MQLQNDSPRLAAHTRREKITCVLLIVGSLLYYWSVFFHYALDAGQSDDFVDVLWFFEILLSREHWQEWFAVIALPSHEHITIFNHMVYLLDYAIFRQVNFFHYILIGHVIVLACCMVLAEWLQKIVGWWYALALVFGIFLNLFYWHASFWAMTALSNQAVILFVLLAARSAALNVRATWAPLTWALLASITQFNGLLVLPALVVGNFVVAKYDNRQQCWRQLLVWSGVFFMTATIYVMYENPFAVDHLWRYANYTDPDHLSDYVKPFGVSLSVNVAHIMDVPLTFMSMVGASVFNLMQWVPAALTGGIFLASLLIIGIRHFAKLDRFWWVLLLFVFASCVLVAVGRGFGFGPASGMYYRYRLYSFLVLLLLMGGVLRVKPRKVVINFFIVVALLVQIVSVHVLDDIAVEKSNIKTSHYNWLVDGGMGRSQMPFYPHNQDLRLFNAYQGGYYNPYNAIDSRYKPVFVSAMKDGACGLDTSAFLKANDVKAWSKKPKALAVEFTLDVVAPANPVQLWFCGNAVSYLFTLDAHNINRDTGKYWPLLILKKQLPPSQYRVLWKQADGNYALLGDISFS